jgi:hypothetical protein
MILIIYAATIYIGSYIFARFHFPIASVQISHYLKYMFLYYILLRYACIVYIYIYTFCVIKQCPPSFDIIYFIIIYYCLCTIYIYYASSKMLLRKHNNIYFMISHTSHHTIHNVITLSQCSQFVGKFTFSKTLFFLVVIIGTFKFLHRKKNIYFYCNKLKIM